MFLWYPVMDLARAPRRTGRKKGSGYENDGRGALSALSRIACRKLDVLSIHYMVY
jgi:hypothetical protein